jgi:3-deoxy-D-manno-octulosonic-acid transferase
VADLVRAAALRASAAALVQAARGRAHPRWRKFLGDSWGHVRRVHHGRPVIWLVCAAGGEVIQTAALGPALREAWPDATVLLSTTNHAFLDVAQRMRGLDACLYTPWDLSRPCRRAVAALAPDLVIAVESAWNPVLLRQARRAGARTMLASGTMVADYHRAAPYRRPMRLRVLDHLDLVGARDDADAAAFGQLGVPPARIRVLGDLRLDAGFAAAAPARERLRDRAGLREGDRVLVAGSVHAGEDAVVLDAARVLAEKLEDFRLVIAPRYLAAVPALEHGCAERGLRASRFTAPARPDAQVVILDTYGDLPAMYGLARHAFLGGSLVKIDLGLGQNLVEPLAHGIPVFFGPHMRRWTSVTSALLAVFPGLQVGNADELVAGVLEVEERPEARAALRSVADGVMRGGADAVARHVDAARALLGSRA